MAILNFPNNPTVNDTYTVNGMTWQWDGERWKGLTPSRTTPIGAQGFQGVQGSPGVQGAQGAQGADGVQGPQGADGAQGSPGVQGAV